MLASSLIVVIVMSINQSPNLSINILSTRLCYLR